MLWEETKVEKQILLFVNRERETEGGGEGATSKGENSYGTKHLNAINYFMLIWY